MSLNLIMESSRNEKWIISFKEFSRLRVKHLVMNDVCDFQSELQLLVQIVPEKLQRSVYDNIVQPGLETVVNEGEVSFIYNHFYFQFSLVRLEILFCKVLGI